MATNKDTNKYTKGVELHCCISEEPREEWITVADVVLQASSLGVPAIAIIGRGSIKEFPQAANAAKRAKRVTGNTIKVIYGCEMKVYMDRDDECSTKKAESFNVLMLVRSQSGLRNLYRLMSLANTEFYNGNGEPSIPKSVISLHRGGIIIGIPSDKGELIDLVFHSADGGELVTVSKPYDFFGERDEEIKVGSTRRLSEMCEAIEPIASRRACPLIDGADKEIESICRSRVKEIYGEQIPAVVSSRLEKELDYISKTGCSTRFLAYKKLVEKAKCDGEPVSFRLSGGSSMITFLTGITDIDPLPPHYICRNCNCYEDVVPAKAIAWTDLPEKVCPNCGSLMDRSGYNIPLKMISGRHFDKEPLLDLCVADDYYPQVKKHIEEVFGKDKVFSAAFDFDEKADSNTRANGVVILTEGLDIYDYTPLERSLGSDGNSKVVCQYGFFDLDVSLFSMIIYTSKDLQLIKSLRKTTGAYPDTTEAVDAMINLMSGVLHSGCEKRLIASMNKLAGISEFENDIINDALRYVVPETFAEVVRLLGLTRGANLWNEMTEMLIESEKASLSNIITCREDIIECFQGKNLSEEESFDLMERIGKGRGLTEMQITNLKAHDVPDWYIDLCGTARYVSFRAPTVEATLVSSRLAWYKLHYPIEFAKALAGIPVR